MIDCSLKKAIQGFDNNSGFFVIGKVVNENPLQLVLENDEKIVLGERMLILTDVHKDKEVDIKIDNVKKKITVYGSLKNGERVYVFKTNSNKKYLVLGRAAV